MFAVQWRQAACLCDWESSSYLGKTAGSSLCSLRISAAAAAMYHTKTAESAVVTWTHFYCNSSIESKKVLININTMPMFFDHLRVPIRSPPPLTFPSTRKKREKEKHEKKKATTRVFLFTGGGFSFSHRGVLSVFHLFCVHDIRRWEIM